MSSLDLMTTCREEVNHSYQCAKLTNHRLFLEGDDKATSEYIYPNQREDAFQIVNLFYSEQVRVISIQKKTKVGADGLMIEIAKLMTTHNDDAFVVNPAHVRILTGMSNAGWEKDMKEKAPSCFQDKIFHHGKLSKSDLKDMRNGLLILDEVDTGNKEFQVLHTTLKDAGILDVKHMKENNNRFVFISATMMRELYDLYQWGPIHTLYKMTIPASYIGHQDFLTRGMVQEFYSLSTKEQSERWIREDILPYATDYRVHLVRLDRKTVETVQNACIRLDVDFRNHTSTDRLSPEDIDEYFNTPLKKHIVLGVKGFFRRANLIPNRWKLRIGATHELYTKKVDNNVQIQGLTGRMTGYWRELLDAGHKTGPHRTSIQSIEEYEQSYLDPFGRNSYQTTGFKKKKGKVSSVPTMLHPKHIANLEAVALPASVDIQTYRIYSDENTIKSVCNILGYEYRPTVDNDEGYKETSLNKAACVVSLREAIEKVPGCYGTNKGVITWRTYLPCYVDTKDKSTLRFVLIVRPNTIEHHKDKLAECDKKHASLRV